MTITFQNTEPASGVRADAGAGRGPRGGAGPPGLDADFRTGRRVAIVGIGASALLATINIAVGVHDQSTSVLATGMELAGDVLASGVVLLGMIVGSRPADEDHPYGHGRVETLAAFVVGMILTIGGAGICWNSLQGIGEVHPPPSNLAIAALGFAILVRGVMSAIKFRIGRRLLSASLVADAWNDAVDILAAGVALGAVGLAMYDQARFLVADHYGGFAVGIIVIFTGLRVLRDASLDLMDTMPDGERISTVRRAAGEAPGVRTVDETYARKTGFKYHVELHVGVDPALNIAEANLIARDVRRRVMAAHAWVADVLVHVEPAVADARE
jgi:cation diffusion facilitator family transporter